MTMKYKINLLFILALVANKSSQNEVKSGNGAISGSFSSSSSSSHTSSSSSSSSGSFSASGSLGSDLNEITKGLKNLVGTINQNGAGAVGGTAADSSAFGTSESQAGGGFGGSLGVNGVKGGGFGAEGSYESSKTGGAGVGYGGVVGSYGGAGSSSGSTGGSIVGSGSYGASTGGGNTYGTDSKIIGGGSSGIGSGSYIGGSSGLISGSGGFGGGAGFGTSYSTGIGAVTVPVGPGTISEGSTCTLGDKKCSGGTSSTTYGENGGVNKVIPVEENKQEGPSGLSNGGKIVTGGTYSGSSIPLSGSHIKPIDDGSYKPGSSTINVGKTSGSTSTTAVQGSSGSYGASISSPGNSGSYFPPASSFANVGPIPRPKPYNYHEYSYTKIPSVPSYGGSNFGPILPQVTPGPSGSSNYEGSKKPCCQGPFPGRPGSIHESKPASSVPPVPAIQVTGSGSGSSSTTYGSHGSGHFGGSYNIGTTGSGSEGPCCKGPFPGPNRSIHDSKPASSVPPPPNADGLTSYGSSFGSATGPCCKKTFPGPNGSIYDSRPASSVSPGPSGTSVYVPATGTTSVPCCKKTFPGSGVSSHVTKPVLPVGSSEYKYTGTYSSPGSTFSSQGPSNVGIASTVNTGSQVKTESTAGLYSGSNSGLPGAVWDKKIVVEDVPSDVPKPYDNLLPPLSSGPYSKPLPTGSSSSAPDFVFTDKTNLETSGSLGGSKYSHVDKTTSPGYATGTVTVEKEGSTLPYSQDKISGTYDITGSAISASTSNAGSSVTSIVPKPFPKPSYGGSGTSISSTYGGTTNVGTSSGDDDGYVTGMVIIEKPDGSITTPISGTTLNTGSGGSYGIKTVPSTKPGLPGGHLFEVSGSGSYGSSGTTSGSNIIKGSTGPSGILVVIDSQGPTGTTKLPGSYSHDSSKSGSYGSPGGSYGSGISVIKGSTGLGGESAGGSYSHGLSGSGSYGGYGIKGSGLSGSGSYGGGSQFGGGYGGGGYYGGASTGASAGSYAGGSVGSGLSGLIGGLLGKHGLGGSLGFSGSGSFAKAGSIAGGSSSSFAGSSASSYAGTY